MQNWSGKASIYGYDKCVMCKEVGIGSSEKFVKVLHLVSAITYVGASHGL